MPLPLPGDTLRAVNVYLLLEEGNAVLIDSGQFLEVARKQLERSLALVGVEVGDVSEFLITHIHRDHYTQAVALRREFNSKVRIGIGEKSSFEIIEKQNETSFERQFGLLSACGADDLYKEARVFSRGDDEIIKLYERPDDWLYEGMTLHAGGRSLDVVSTPGHTRGHVVFHDRASKLLFAGDHVLPHITPSIALEADRPHLPLGDYLGSLAKVRQLPDARLLPAHGPVIESGHLRIDELILHHDLRLRQTYDALGDRSCSVYDVAHILKWTRHMRDLSDMDLFNKMLATFETKYHLDLLVEMGMVDLVVDGDILIYSKSDRIYDVHLT
jgi:glyoxylase-like metal-dependent hydrolase (beta-lactamase superfamily II)